MQPIARSDDSNDFLTLTRAPPSHAQTIFALGIVPAIMAVALAVAKPFATVPLRPIEAFVPFYVTAIFLSDLLTASLLLAQYSILRTRSMLIVANGFLFAALMLIPYTLAFPGVFGPGSLIGDLQTTPWLYIIRHCGLALFLAAFAASDSDRIVARPRDEAGRAMLLSLLATAILVLCAGLLSTYGGDLLPRVINDHVRFADNWFLYAGVPMTTFYTLALVLLWRRRNTILGLWLMVVVFVHLVGVPLSFRPSPLRFSVGWYTVIVFNLLANALVLIVLLVESSQLYARVMHAVRTQRREREARLVTGDAVAAMIAHDVKQPLSAMITRAEAGLRRLDRAIPDIDKAREDIRQVAADGYRAAGVIDSIRANFRKETRPRTAIDVDLLVRETIALIRDDLQRYRVTLQEDLRVGAAPLKADRTQLQQVLLNLFTNAIDAMASDDGPRLITVRSESRAGAEIIVSVSDTGKGIAAGDADRIFNPLFTTKAGGMGMGLSICRSIIEAHEGRIWATPGEGRGVTFQFALPFGG